MKDSVHRDLTTPAGEHNVSWQTSTLSFRERRDSFPITILLFGPGKTNPGFTKRQEILLTIKRELKSADVKMSEDVDLKVLTGNLIGNEEDEELEQALATDLLICLDTSKGAGEEIAKFGTYPRIAVKMFVLTPKEYQGNKSIAAIFRTKHQCYFFTDDEFNEPDRLGMICVEFIRIFINKKIAFLPP